MTAVILAGGKGTRMSGLFPDIPKPLIPVCGKSVLLRQTEALAANGIKKIIIVTGYLSEKIERDVSLCKKKNADISFFTEKTPLGTAGALFKLELNDDFLLLGGDLIFDVSFEKMLAFHKNNNALATLFSHPNSHPADSALIKADEQGRITDFIPKENREGYFQNLCNAGIQIISPELLRLFRCDGKADLDADILRPAVKTGRIFSYKSSEYVRDMGTPERYAAVSKDVERGLVSQRNLNNKQKAVFLDRDGTINVFNGFITSPGQLSLIPGAAQAIKKINSLGYLAVVITNQPVIARGDITESELKNIHNRLETLLGEEGAYLDGIFYCPHHPDSGFIGERTRLKIKCECRKPAPGLILRAAREFNIDLSQSYMAGDSRRDIFAAQNAGCTPVFIGDDLPENSPKNALLFGSLKEFADSL
ncbi:MAG: HAD-IIIA family hydrolase [Oscillospiraceae bacterium]|nr:HAD-IIIA family hydrolase [Oscillospiraceae bacterium]